MPVNIEQYKKIKRECDAKSVTLIAVSKTKPVPDILELYDLGHRDFGENYVQEVTEKQAQLPKDIRWHFIGHLQRNKVKYLAPFIHLIHCIDSFPLLQEVSKHGAKHNRVISVLLQMHIAEEETKFGLDEAELKALIADLADVPLPAIRIEGFMGMASFTSDTNKVQQEFKHLASLYKTYKELQTSTIRMKHLSIGMSNDYQLALEEGTTMVRIGSLLFGARD